MCMKKAVVLLALLALVGCDEDDIKDILNGETKVFAVSGVQVEGSASGLPDGYYKMSDLKLIRKPCYLIISLMELKRI